MSPSLLVIHSPPLAGLGEQLASLRCAVAIARALGAELLLPRWWVGAPPWAACNEVVDSAALSKLVPLVSDAVYETELEGFTEFRANGWKATGESELLETVLQQHLSGGFSATQVVIYACVSLAGTDVVTANSGESVVPSDRPEVLAFEVAFEGQPQGSIVIVDERLWSEAEFCAAD